MEGFTHEDFLKCMENKKFKKFILKEVNNYLEEIEKQKSKLDKKHDKIYKMILSKKEERVKYIKRVYGITFGIDEIELYDKEFRDETGKVLEADIIYKIKNKKIFFLVEHQTKKDISMQIRLLKYDIQIMKSCAAKNKDEKEGLVLASVIHTGKDKWDVPTNIMEVQEKIGDLNNIIDDIRVLGNYRLLDINDFTKEELLESDNLLDKAMYLEKSKSIIDFIRGVRKVFKVIKEDDENIMSDVVRIALAGIVSPEKIERIIINAKGGRKMLAVTERMKNEVKGYETHGIRKISRLAFSEIMPKEKIEFLVRRARDGGKANNKLVKEEISKAYKDIEDKGRIEGEISGKKEVARNLLNMGYSIKEVEKITNLKEADFKE